MRCRGWQQEAALRMLENNLHPDVAEKPQELVVYGGIGKAARNQACLDAIKRELTRLGDDETLLVQSGKPVAVFETHAAAPRVLIANSNLVGKWANWEHFRELDAAGLMMYGQMTAGSWIYIGAVLQTVTTVGYGDVVPGNTAGKVIASFLMLGGLSLYAVVTGAITSAFVADAQARRRAGKEDPVTRRLEEITAQLEAIRAELARLDSRSD